MHKQSVTRVAAVVLLVAVGRCRPRRAGSLPATPRSSGTRSQRPRLLDSRRVAPLSLAMVQGAVYDAVNAIDGGHQPYLVSPPANASDSKEAAVATAAFRVLVGFPDLQVCSQRKSRPSSRSTTRRSRTWPTVPLKQEESRSARRRPGRCSSSVRVTAAAVPSPSSKARIPESGGAAAGTDGNRRS